VAGEIDNEEFERLGMDLVRKRLAVTAATAGEGWAFSRQVLSKEPRKHWACDKYTTSDGRPLHYEPATIPDLIGPNFLIPASVSKFFRKLFRRQDTHAAR
jgi:hypothetical protein